MGGWSAVLLLGLEGLTCLEASSASGRLKLSTDAGKRLDVPKVLVAFCDPVLGSLCHWSSASRPLPKCGLNAAQEVLPHERQTEADSFCTLLKDLATTVDQFHRGLEDLRPEAATSNSSSRAQTITRGLWALSRQDREALADENSLLRARSEKDTKRFEQEVNQLRIAHRRALQEREGREGSMPSTRGSPREPLTPEAQLQRLLEEIPRGQQQVEEYRQRLIDQRVRNAKVEHQALNADKEKETILKLYSTNHHELRHKRDKQQDNLRRKVALEAEVKELEQRLAKLSEGSA